MIGARLPLVVAAMLLAALAVSFGWQAFGLGFVVDEVPGPGLLPVIVAALLLAFLGLMVTRPALAEDEGRYSATPFVAMPLLLVYAAVLPVGGVVLPTIGLVVAWSAGLGRRPWLQAIALAVILTGALVLLFRGILGVPLPLWPRA